MLLSDLFANLSYGPLSNLAIGGTGSGTIPAQHESRMVYLTNKAVSRIYTRFILSEKELIIRAYDNQTLYPLEVQYADSNTDDVPQKFIADTVSDPFLGDVIQVLQVFDDGGWERPINDQDDADSLFLPKPTLLQIPGPVTGDVYHVLYQAAHPSLSLGNLLQNIDIPEPLAPALEHLIAYNVMSPMNGAEHTQKAAEHLSMYESICSRVEETDVLNTSLTSSNYKFENRGFV